MAGVEPSEEKGEEMASDEALVLRLRELLRSSDLEKTSNAALRRQLESDFGVDLSHKKQFLREQVDLLLQFDFTGVGAEVENLEGEEKRQVGTAGDESAADQEEGGKEEEVEHEEEGEEEDEDDKGASAAGGSRKRQRGMSLKKMAGSCKRKGGGFTKLCSLSSDLQNFVGASELARTEVVKKLWDYIKENKLQDPANKRKIICDEKLVKLFKVATIDMFQMNKALTKHIWPLNCELTNACSVSAVATKPKDLHLKKEKKNGKRQKQGSSGLLTPLQLSDELVKFIGTGETMLSRSDVVKRMWDYIKQNDLQDPSDRRKIICDERLQELFNVKSFTGFTVSKLLAPHLSKMK